jgi:hypothetical protein
MDGMVKTLNIRVYFESPTFFMVATSPPPFKYPSANALAMASAFPLLYKGCK